MRAEAPRQAFLLAPLPSLPFPHSPLMCFCRARQEWLPSAEARHPLAARGKDSSISQSVSSAGTAPRSSSHSSLALPATRPAALTVRAREQQPGLGAPYTLGAAYRPLGNPRGATTVAAQASIFLS